VPIAPLRPGELRLLASGDLTIDVVEGLPV